MSKMKVPPAISMKTNNGLKFDRHKTEEKTTFLHDPAYSSSHLPQILKVSRVGSEPIKKDVKKLRLKPESV
jgi:hypothetical protein